MFHQHSNFGIIGILDGDKNVKVMNIENEFENENTSNSGGGIISEVNGSINLTINRCVNKTNIKNGMTIGGIIGCVNDDTQLNIYNSKNLVQLTYGGNVGGMIGQVNGENICVNIENSSSTGEEERINVGFYGGCIGNVSKMNKLEIKDFSSNEKIIVVNGRSGIYSGVVGKIQNSKEVKINNIRTNGKIKSEESQSLRMAGVIGEIDGNENYDTNVEISNAENGCDIESNLSAAGIIDYIYGSNMNFKINENTNNGNITTKNICSGIVGEISGQSDINITKSENNGTLNSDRTVGGIIGYANGKKIIIDECKNKGNVGAASGDVDSMDSIGGIIGNSDNNVQIIRVSNCENDIESFDCNYGRWNNW